ncbi:uncharacterized protein [Montipora capricornis]|uniref:uncharacterized protein isoform X1 n=1 Tax=Montipora capricornis TaxID=246305 RepID=UPI0035F1988E
MKFFNVFIAIVVLTCPTFTEGQMEYYNLEINEKGTIFTEGIEIDEEQKIEVLRVPAHNDVPAVDFYHDLEMSVTVMKILSEQVCYITKMEPSLPSPQKLKEDIKRAATQRGSLPVTTKQNLLRPMGPVHRPSLTKGVLAFCGVFPIYKADVSPMKILNSGEETIWREPRTRIRRTRQVMVNFRNFTACNKFEIFARVEKCMEDDGHWDLSCKLKTGGCYYYVSCRNQLSIGNALWKCEESHITYPTPVCCDLVCPLPPLTSTPLTPTS